MTALAFLNEMAESKSTERLKYELSIDFGYTDEQIAKMDRSDMIHHYIVEWRLHGIGFMKTGGAV